MPHPVTPEISNLDQIADDQWQSLAAAAQDRHHAWHTPTLGNVCVESNDQDVAVGDAVTLAIRPENLKLRSASVPGAVRVTLAASAFWGHTTYYRVVVTGAEGESLDVAQQDYSGSEKAGDEAWLGFDSEDLLLLKN